MAKTNGSPRKASDPIIELRVPIKAEVSGYVQRHVDMQLSPQEGEALNRLRAALDERNEVKIRGRGISGADACRWLLAELVKEAAG